MKVAVVGSGVSGLVSAWLLQRRHEVSLFEASEQVGGHVATVPVQEQGRELAVDMGFIVYNERTYPLFCRLIRALGVATEASSMSFSVRSDSSVLEYNGSTLNQLFAQRRNLLRPSFYSMVAGILRFHRQAPRLLESEASLSLGEFLAQEKLSGPFVDHYLLPMAAAIWSTPPREVLSFPAATMARFLHNHGMLSVDDRPQWRVISGGSQRYVDHLMADFRGSTHVATPVQAVRRRTDGVELALPNGGWQAFDAVVLATHSDQSLRLLSDPTAAEQEVLGAISYRDNAVTLHRDPSLMPRRQSVWASWNYHLEGGDEAPRLTYWMNELQNLESARPLLVTLNSDEQLDLATAEHQKIMGHPQFGAGSDLAKARWSEISQGGTIFCGAYWGNGFHEDGVRSAARAAQALGVSWPEGEATREHAA